MQLHNVDSSMMNAIGYDEASQTLVIVFNSGRVVSEKWPRLP